MLEQNKKIKELLKNYGIEVKEKMIERSFQGMGESYFQRLDMEAKIGHFVAYLSGGYKRFEITDFTVFSDKLNLEDRWKEVPEWFGNGITLNYDGRTMRFILKTTKGRSELDDLQTKLKHADKYFSNQLTPEKLAEYNFKKVMVPSESTEMLFPYVMQAYIEMEYQEQENDTLKQLVKELKTIVEKKSIEELC